MEGSPARPGDLDPPGPDDVQQRSLLQEYRTHYQGGEVARTYVERRFSHPVWTALHRREVRIVNGWLARERPGLVCDVAMGPARMSRHLRPIVRGVGVDTSPEMVREARRHVTASRWTLLVGDAAALPLGSGQVDALSSFRFLRHFPAGVRRVLLAEWRRVLRPHGVLVFEALNDGMGSRMREIAGLGRANCFEQPLHDATWTRASLERELDDAGFALVEVVPVLCHPRLYFDRRVIGRLRAGGVLLPLLDRVPPRGAYQWEVLARRRP